MKQNIYKVVRQPLVFIEFLCFYKKIQHLLE